MVFYEENPQQITKADIVVGVPSFNEAENIGNTTLQVAKGLKNYFGDLNSVIINCDNHSADGTREAFFSAAGEIPKIYLSTPPGVRGKGNSLRIFFEKVRELKAGIVIVVEADIRNISPEWIRNLGTPIARGAGYTVPLYVRHKYEATLTSSLIYPLLRCLYGRRIRQPNVGDFGFKGQLVDSFLNSPVWTDAVEGYGVDIWMTNIALSSRMPICQSFMGCPKIHRVIDPYAHLQVLFHQALSTIFDLMTVYADFWHQVKWSKPAALFGTDTQEVEMPLPTEINAARMHERFIEGFDKYSGIWQQIYGQTIFPKLQEIRGLGIQHFSFPTQTWARILFDTANSYRSMNSTERYTLLDALLPLYLGKVLSFVKKTERMSLQQSEEYVENECTIFEENKPYIIKAWE